ncbi:type II toxin-antitoxin system RelE/ParE family toxin [Candidatus Uhrbacteria bacterium]|nr:type II toxin-antitoxin system RelE/ParE family toxin [Candidatus Uhrbacteria bacterium]
MIEIVYGERFLQSARELPGPQQRKLARLLETLHENPFHPLLHTKRLSGDLAGIHAFRITRDWRVMFQFNDPTTVQLLRVAHRKDIYR